MKNLGFCTDTFWSWLFSRFEVISGVVDSEHEFLNKLIEKLGIEEEEERQIIPFAIQSFVNKNQVKFLSSRIKVTSSMLMSGATDQWRAKILGRSKINLHQIITNKELVALI
ncbi:MAG: hypothetical protein IPO32_13020 [Crocinitomicaceae bacterium]|nr:hypothetical protein [Crocinitomicaceae bacterium]